VANFDVVPRGNTLVSNLDRGQRHRQ
jgi:hypothetical protein